MMVQREASQFIIDFSDDVGILEYLVIDGALEFTGKGTDFVWEAQKMQIHLSTSEQERKNQNHLAE